MADTFTLHVKDNLLQIRENPLQPQSNDQILPGIVQQLQTLIEAGQLKGGELLKITGKHTLPMAYVLSHQLSHLFGAIAVFDPKLSAYVVAISHSPKFHVGECLE